MRKNTTAVFNAWHAGRTKGKLGDSISTDGKTIFSYCIKILWRVKRRTLFLNNTYYSNTTRQQQNQLITLLTAKGIEFVCVPTNLK